MVRLMGIPAAGIVGGLVFGLYGLLPLRSPDAPSHSGLHQIIAQKPVIQAAELTGTASAEQKATDANAIQLDDRQASAKPSCEAILQQKLDRLRQGKQFLSGFTDYRVTMHKQEVVKGQLLDPQTMMIKCRQKPFSLYLVWEQGDGGREVIYVEGKNDGKMIAHDGGWKARIPAFTLDIHGMLAMRDTRYPVSMAGVLGLIDRMAGIHEDDLTSSNFASCDVQPAQSLEGRPCDMYVTKYKSAQHSPHYRKSITLIDHEWNLPLQSQHFEWLHSGADQLNDSQLDEATLIESYSFTNLEFDCHLSDSDFDRTNPEYRFR